MPLNLLKTMKQCLLMAVFVMLLFPGCGNEEKADLKSDFDTTSSPDSLSSVDNYVDWLTYSYHNYQIIYPEGHVHADNLQTIIDGMERAAAQTCQLLAVPIPTDSIIIYYYTGLGHGREITGRQWPYIEGNVFHLWRPSYPHIQMVEYVLRKWQDYEPKFKFLKVGLMVLLDYSGENYHAATLNYVDDGIFFTLAELAEDTTINPYGERWQSAEAASFMAYLLDYYGTKGLFGLYRSKHSFEETCMGLFSKSPATLQEEWIHYADSLYTASLQTGN